MQKLSKLAPTWKLHVILPFWNFLVFNGNWTSFFGTSLGLFLNGEQWAMGINLMVSSLMGIVLVVSMVTLMGIVLVVLVVLVVSIVSVVSMVTVEKQPHVIADRSADRWQGN